MKKSKWYLVTGGGSGIGACTAQKIISSGGNVVIIGSNEKKLENTIKQLGTENYYYSFDLSNIENISSIFDFINSKGIKLQGMVNCAGVSPLTLLADNEVSEMERVYRINTFSFIELSKLFYTYGAENGSIVTISSIAAHLAGYRQILYGGSKAACIASVKLMAKELLNKGMRVNCVSPGVTDTGMLDSLREKSYGLDEKIKQSQPLGIIPPERIADMVVFLLSDKASHITGQEFFCDGGSMLR